MKYGRHRLLFNNKIKAIGILLPPSPTKVNDVFLNEYFKNAKKQNTPGNILKRWEHATLTKYKGKKQIEGELDIQVLFNYLKDRKPVNNKRDTAIINNIIKEIEKDRVTSLSFIQKEATETEYILVLIRSPQDKDILNLENDSILFAVANELL